VEDWIIPGARFAVADLQLADWDRVNRGLLTAVRNLLGRYFWWTEERGSLHYDVMVTLILLFLFLAPHFIDFNDRPVETVALHSSEVLVKEAGRSDGSARFMYQIRADQEGGPQPSQNEEERQRAILRVVEPISGEVTLERYEPVYDSHHAVVAYDAWVLR
jgi:hypothetical protein